MDILFIAIPVALGIVAVFVWAFWWSVRTGQLDDLETPAIRMLFDDNPEHPDHDGAATPEAKSKT